MPLRNRESITSALPLNFNSSVAPLDIETSAASARPRFVSESLPACTVVLPEYELVAVKDSVPAPFLMRPPAPVAAPLIGERTGIDRRVETACELHVGGDRVTALVGNQSRGAARIVEN